tara:strand:- start:368 stop:2116 length:1749 start_codon:yes stop_codon:yes gene_type:complete
MSDKIIKINSVQGFAETWLESVSPTTLDLVDFVIPRGITADLSKSYIAFNVQTTSDQPDKVHNVDLFLDVQGGDPFNTPNSALMRNASISCDKGQIENIRRLDSLSCGLWSMSNDAETQKGDMNAMATYEDERGLGNRTSFLLDCVVQNVNPDGTNDGRKSRQISRDIKIPLKDMFGIGMAEDWSTDIFGETRIHCETNFNKLETYKLGGQEDTKLSFDVTNTWGSVEDIAMAAGETVDDITLKVDYLNLDVDLVCPFFVGESVIMTSQEGKISQLTLVQGGVGYAVGNTGTFGGGGDASGATYEVTAVQTIGANSGVISAFTLTNPGINYELTSLLTFDGNGTTPAEGQITGVTAPVTNTAIIDEIETENNAGKEQVKISFATAIHTNGAAADTLRNITLKAENTQTNSIVVNRAELVLFTVNQPNPSESFQYVTYLTEQDNGNSLVNLHRQYIVEPECQNLFVAHILNNAILPAAPYTSYRISVDNEDITGNRSVVVDSPLQYDRLNRCLNLNSTVEWRNAQMRFFQSDQSQANAYGHYISMICETMAITKENKKVGLEINAEGKTVQQLILYKQIVKSI